MGYSTNVWKYFNKCFIEAGLLKKGELPVYGTLNTDENYYQKEMLELGAQVFRSHYVKRNIVPKTKLTKDYFNSIGINCISVDIRDRNASIILDLREPVDKEWKNKFDIITNCGTTEHVHPIEGQYQAFKNIHFCCKKGGIMFHFVPVANESFKNHSPFYYKDNFFETLAELNNYEVINLEKVDRKGGDFYWGVCFRKIEDNKFTENKSKFFKNILEN